MIPFDVQRQSRRSGLAALLASAGQARPGYLGQGLLSGLGAQDQAQRLVLEDYMRQRMEQEESELRRRYRESLMQGAEQDRAFRERQAMEEERQRQEGARQRAMIAQQYAQQVISQLPEGDPRQATAWTMAQQGDLSSLQQMAQEVAEDAQRRAYYESQGLDPSSPIAKDLLEKKYGVNQPSPPAPMRPELRQGADGQFYAFDPASGQMSPVEGGPPPAVGDVDRMALRDAVSAIMKGNEGSIDPAGALQRSLPQVFEMFREQYRRAMGGEGDPARPQPGLTPIPGGLPTAITPRGTLPTGGVGSTSPTVVEPTYSISGQQKTHSQMVALTRGTVLSKGEQVARSYLEALGIDDATIEQLIREANAPNPR